MPAFTIAIEGSDGAGKATQTDLLANYLIGKDFKVGRVSFPRYDGTPAGRMLFEFLKSPRSVQYDFANSNPKLASRIYAQDRLESLEYLNGLIEHNDYLIFDRWVESNLLHQGGKFINQSEKQAFAKWLYELEYEELKLPKPDFVLYLDLPYTISHGRALNRARKAGEQLDAVESNAEYVKNGWLAGIFYTAMFNWEKIDCIVPREGNQLVSAYEFTPDEIHLKIRDLVNTRKK
jgi:dTMP kinase